MPSCPAALPPMPPGRRPQPATVEAIAGRIRSCRGHAVLLGGDLAGVCGASVNALLRGLEDARASHPGELCFCLEPHEVDEDEVPGAPGGRGRRYAFTEQGALVAVARQADPEAIATVVRVLRAFRSWRKKGEVPQRFA